MIFDHPYNADCADLAIVPTLRLDRLRGNGIRGDEVGTIRLLGLRPPPLRPKVHAPAPATRTTVATERAGILLIAYTVEFESSVCPVARSSTPAEA